MFGFIEGFHRVYVYLYDKDYRVDIDIIGDNVELWLYHKQYGVKSLMFGIENNMSLTDLIDIIDSNIKENIEIYKKDYEDIE